MFRRLALSSILLFSHPVFALKATLYELSHPERGPVFFYSSDEQLLNGEIIRTADFKSVGGDIVAEEKIRTVAGQLTQYELNQNQSDVRVVVRRSDNEFQTTVEHKGKISQSKTLVRPNLILPPQLIEHLGAKLNFSSDENRVEFTMLIPDLMRTISFTARQVTAENNRLRLQLKPANFLIALFAPPPLYFEWDRTTKRILLVEGQTLLFDKNKKPFLAKTVFNYP